MQYRKARRLARVMDNNNPDFKRANAVHKERWMQKEFRVNTEIVYIFFRPTERERCILLHAQKILIAFTFHQTATNNCT